MARYWRALLGGKLLAPAQLAAMKTTVPIGKGNPGSYGLGLMRFTQYSKTCGVLWGNGGDIPGFSSDFFNSEDGTRQAGVIVNVNPIPKAVSGESLGALESNGGRRRARPRALLAATTRAAPEGRAGAVAST